jgi:hypothetical protein
MKFFYYRIYIHVYIYKYIHIYIHVFTRNTISVVLYINSFHFILQILLYLKIIKNCKWLYNNLIR